MLKPIVTLLLLAGLAACASAPPPETDFVDRARAAIEAAEAAGADQHAPLELRFSREKLDAAELANTDGDVLQARRLARQAEVDAELCLAKTAAALAREAARTQREANLQLQAELEEGQ